MSPTPPSDQTLGPQTEAPTESGAPDRSARRMIRGRWQDPETAKMTPRADRTLSVRLTEAELAEFDAQIAVLGVKRNRALRIAARRIGGFVEVDPATIEELRALNRQLAGIATNINQIAHAANRTHDPDYQAFLNSRAELGRVLLETRGALQRILNLGARREDGLARLKATTGRETVEESGAGA